MICPHNDAQADDCFFDSTDIPACLCSVRGEKARFSALEGVAILIGAAMLHDGVRLLLLFLLVFVLPLLTSRVWEIVSGLVERFRALALFTG